MVYNNIPRTTSKSFTVGNTFMKRSPGECFMCKTNQEVRYFDLFVIGSEGCHLCLPCEIKVVEMVRQAANQALENKKQEFRAQRQKQKMVDLAKNYGSIPPKNAFTGMVSG